MSETGETITGPGSQTAFRNAGQTAQKYGGNAADWVKKSSSHYNDATGADFETHWVENVKTGQRVEFKTKLPESD